MVWLDSVRLRSRSPKTRRRAIESLTAPGNLRGLKLLISSLSDPDREVRASAARALAEINQQLSVAARVAALADNGAAPDVTASSLQSVHKSGRLQLGSKALSSDLSTRLGATSGFAAEPTNPETAALLDKLGDSDVTVRLGAAQALESIANPAHLNHFLTLLADDHFEVRIAAINYLRRIGDPQLAQALLPRLTDPDSDVRIAAAKALGAIRNHAVIEPLVLSLTDEEQAVRQAVSAALDAIDTRWIRSQAAQEAMPRLELMRKDSRPWIAAAADKVLDKLKAAKGKDTELWKRESGLGDF